MSTEAKQPIATVALTAVQDAVYTQEVIDDREYSVWGFVDVLRALGIEVDESK